MQSAYSASTAPRKVTGIMFTVPLDALRRVSQVLSRDIHAVRNASREDWSNGQPEGQINN